PFHPQGEDNDGHSEDDAGYEAVERRVMDSYGQVGQDKRQSGRGLRFVAQAVSHDGGRNGEHQEEIKFAGIDDVRGGHVIDGVADEIKKSPASGGAGSSENAVTLVGFVAHSDGDHGGA